MQSVHACTEVCFVYNGVCVCVCISERERVVGCRLAEDDVLHLVRLKVSRKPNKLKTEDNAVYISSTYICIYTCIHVYQYIYTRTQALQHKQLYKSRSSDAE